MMLLAALLLMAQEAPAPAPEKEDTAEIVVRASFGRTTMLFDKGADGKLRNCRIMISSGSQKRDTNACGATPVCYEKTADVVTDCIEFVDLGPVAPAATPPGGTGKPFELPQLVRLAPAPAPSALLTGPRMDTGDRTESDRERVRKLPPPPSAPHDPSAIHVTTGASDRAKEP